MSLPSSGVWELRSSSTANNVNGGGFNSARGGTDYTLQDAAQLHSTDGVSTASTTFTSATGGFTSAMVGNYLHLISATGADEIVGWYEIVTFVDTNTITLDRVSGTYAVGDFYVGGATSLNSTLDDEMFEAAVAGNTFWVKFGTFTIGETISIATAGTSLAIKIIGYKTTRGDVPTGSDRPTILTTTFTLTLGPNWEIYNMSCNGTGPTVVSLGTGGKIVNVKVCQSSTIATRSGITMGSDSIVLNCEAIAYRCRAITASSGAIVGCYIHDSDIGVLLPTGTNVFTLNSSIVSSCVTAALASAASAQTGRSLINGNTLCGSVNTTGIGVSLITGVTDTVLLNNIIYGFVTGVSHDDTQTIGYDDYNDYNNNDTDVTNWTKGDNDVTTAPGFTNVAQLTGATATTSGSVLTQSGGDFSTVVDGIDFIYIVSGTGVTVGIYGITSHDATTVTLDIAPGTNATADKVWQITTGHNFLPTGGI